MSNIFYDTEFLERGHKYPIDLISIGMVSEDDKWLYLINKDAPLDEIAKHEWLRGNVVPYLPLNISIVPDGLQIYWNEDHPLYGAVVPRSVIADCVKDFVLGSGIDPKLWAWYGAYDHVVLAQLFNTMAELPDGFPMWTNDLKQEVERVGDPRLPSKGNKEHDALEDARWVKKCYDWLKEYEKRYTRV